MENKIKEYINKHFDEIVNDLIFLAKLEAPSSDVEALSDVRAGLKQLIEKRLNKEVEEIEVPSTRNVLYMKNGNGCNPILFMGHYDTVHPIGKLPIILEDDVLKGPGVLDMKAGLVQGIWACKAIQELELPVKYPIHLMFNGDEEIGSHDSKEILVDKAKEAKYALILEPAVENGDLKTGRKGGTTCEITIHGKASHAGNNPEAGINAILEMAHHIIALQDLNKNDKKTTVSVGKIQGGTATNVVPDLVKVSVDLRYQTVTEKERIKQAILDLPLVLEGTKKEVSFSAGSNPMEETIQNLELFELAKECAKLYDITLGHQFVGGASDGNRISSLGIPILDGLGAVGKGIHALNEQVDLKQYQERICLLISLCTKIGA